MEMQEENRFRRWRGVLLGIGLGLVYGLASQYANTFCCLAYRSTSRRWARR